jgi:hypothetical protein
MREKRYCREGGEEVEALQSSLFSEVWQERLGEAVQWGRKARRARHSAGHCGDLDSGMK